MNARSWFAMVLGTLLIPAASTALACGSGFSDAAYRVADVQVSVSVVSDVSSSLMPNGSGTVSPYNFEKISNLDSGQCSSGNCAKLRATAFAHTGERRPEHSAIYGDRSDPDAMTPLDLGLMLLFAVGLIAYQLDRKQRVLRQASLFPASLN